MNQPSQSSAGKTALIIIVVALVAVLAYSVLTMPDNRTGAERVGDAISELPNGVDEAAGELEDKTPADRIGDAVEDAGDSIENATDGK